MKLNWIPGRQGGDYWKLPVIQTKWFDTWLIKFAPGYELPPHFDPVDGKIHYRCNIRLYGEDAYRGAYLFRFWRIIVFRADRLHYCIKLTKPRMLLSIGWARDDVRTSKNEIR